MSSNAYLTNLKVEVASQTSPETFTELPEVIGGVKFGETLPLVNVSSMLSESEEYIGGLPDGDEFSVECNRIINASPDVQGLFISLSGQIRKLRITITNKRVTPNVSKVYEFDAVFLGWTSSPSVGEQDKISFNFKITGGIQEL